MSDIKKPFLVLLAGCFSLLIAQAQSTIPASGGNAGGSGGSVSYTVGQIVNVTISGSNGSVIEGVQQPFEISVITEVGNTEEITLSCSVYPNPVTYFLTLKIGTGVKVKLSYKLYNINGKLLENKKILTDETQIAMVTYASGTYLLRVTDNKKDLKTFKIIKN